MYAIFEAKGKQFRAEPEATLRLPTLEAEPGERVTFDHVLVAGRDEETMVGRPALEGASVSAEVLRHGRGDKIVVYKMKRRKGHRKKQGHRQGFTEVRVVDIEFGTGKPAAGPAKARKAPAKKAASKKAATKAAKPATAAQAEVPATAEAAPATEAAKPTEPVAIEATGTARALAEEHGVDLATIEGTGKEGRILKSDVEKAIKEREGN
jgi:large subunit ribosomal protein L21